MNADREFEEILRRVASLACYEKTEALLAYFTMGIESMDTRSLLDFRRYCRARYDETEAETTMLDIIDGQLALREIAALGG